MGTDHVQLIWNRGCAGTAEAACGSRVDVGPGGPWTAEQLLVAAVESAVMTSFIEIAGESDLELLGYVSSAGAATDASKPGGLTIVVRPCIVVAHDGDRDRARALLPVALERSPVTRALAGVLRVDPEVVVVGSSPAH